MTATHCTPALLSYTLSFYAIAQSTQKQHFNSFYARYLNSRDTSFKRTAIMLLAQRFLQVSASYATATNRKASFTAFNLTATPPTLQRFLAHDPVAEERDISATVSHLHSIHTVDSSLNLEGMTRVEWAKTSQAEVLSKVLAYRNLTHFVHRRETLVLPRYAIGGKKALQTRHTIERIELGSGLFAFGLIPDHEEAIAPILLFRGTAPFPSAEGALETMLADLDPEGIAWRAFVNGQKNLATWLRKHCTDECRAIVTGHSAGGTLAHYSAAFFARYIHKGITFNPTGVNKATKRAWEALEFSGIRRPSLKAYVTKGDILPYFGQHIIGDIFEISTHEKFAWLLDGLQAHNYLCLNRQQWSVRKLNRIEHEVNYLRHICAQVRGIASATFHFIKHFTA